MNYKEFFKPTIGKIILFIVLFLISFFILSKFFILAGDPFPQGFPFTFVQFSGCSTPSPNSCWDTKMTSYFNLFLDIIFWYLISCIIFPIFRKYKT